MEIIVVDVFEASGLFEGECPSLASYNIVVRCIKQKNGIIDLLVEVITIVRPPVSLLLILNITLLSSLRILVLVTPGALLIVMTLSATPFLWLP